MTVLPAAVADPSRRTLRARWAPWARWPCARRERPGAVSTARAVGVARVVGAARAVGAARVVGAVGAAGVALGWHNVALPRLGLDARGRTAANVAVATVFARVFDGDPRWSEPRGRRWGLGSAAVVLTGYGLALAIPAARRALAATPDRAPGVGIAEWVTVHIPLGTVYSEELIFRGTLDPLLGLPGTAAVFGLWHIHPARAAGDPVPVAVAATAAAGLVFGLLRRTSGSAIAPALLHLAVNAGGALAPYLARRIAR